MITTGMEHYNPDHKDPVFLFHDRDQTPRIGQQIGFGDLHRPNRHVYTIIEVCVTIMSSGDKGSAVLLDRPLSFGICPQTHAVIWDYAGPPLVTLPDDPITLVSRPLRQRYMVDFLIERTLQTGRVAIDDPGQATLSSITSRLRIEAPFTDDDIANIFLDIAFSINPPLPHLDWLRTLHPGWSLIGWYDSGDTYHSML
jgi:hypothetical protein